MPPELRSKSVAESTDGSLSTPCRQRRRLDYSGNAGTAEDPEDEALSSTVSSSRASDNTVAQNDQPQSSSRGSPRAGSFMHTVQSISSLQSDIDSNAKELNRLRDCMKETEETQKSQIQARQGLLALQDEESKRAAQNVRYNPNANPRGSLGHLIFQDLLDRINAPDSVEHGMGLVPLSGLPSLAYTQTFYKSVMKGRVFKLFAEALDRSPHDIQALVEEQSLKDPVAPFVLEAFGFQGYLDWLRSLRAGAHQAQTTWQLTLQVLAWTLDVKILAFREGKQYPRVLHPYGSQDQVTPVVAVLRFSSGASELVVRRWY